ncbi:thiamine pyrophosphate-binding protein [Leptospira meyeri]|uniref:thiamine pyrophosphate-binding protein n=1 Tax=Leptospira meyeri TaxID=29508 RepID=UPI000C2983D9|nr:thiamine pyrophosphate-binding protein [Leptospira meyeri]PJZ80331.1 acetolactate synthase large subunit [Leptospira meyeri]PJZ95522.1 acetolactate synthase large subunit [Leptospira meyeri]PKA10653.1 acetolactate synthase large subunit [Leptospira meyeri]TGL12446.1 thiamine pyrophosphate-binding protein [Leptospira meyeri]
MKKTGAWLVRYALEQIGVRFTFGIPGVHNTEIYDELNNSELIHPMLVTHEGCGAFMADAISRTSVSIGTVVIVPAAGVTHAASGIGEAFLDGIPMLVIAGGVRSDSKYKYQLHDMDQHTLVKPITKKTFKVNSQEEVVETIYQAYQIAVTGEPGPVFIEIPVNIQLYTGPVENLPSYQEYCQMKTITSLAVSESKLEEAVELLSQAKSPGLFLGWGAVDATESSVAIAELLGAPVATTLQGLSAFPGNHPLHCGMSFGPAAVPAATKAFADCDCLLAVGTRFAEIATGSFGVTVPKNLIHIDINEDVFHKNYPAKVNIQGDAKNVLPELVKRLQNKLQLTKESREDRIQVLTAEIKKNKQNYMEEWFQHDSKERVNPARFFNALRSSLPDDGFVVVDDGNHTFLTAELMPIHTPRHMISPTDFNCMGYAVPATIATKLANPDKAVVGIIGDGAFLMTCMELITASRNKIGAVFAVFNDGELSQISQAQQVPYNRKTCTVLGTTRFEGIALATGAEYINIQTNDEIKQKLDEAWDLTKEGRPVILDVHIDYSKKTRFTQGIVGTNLKRLPFAAKIRMIGRALVRKVTG